MGLCLFANNHVIDHEETRMIDQNKKPTAVYFAGVIRKGKKRGGLVKVLQKYKILHTDSAVRAALELQRDVLALVAATLHLK